MDDRFPHQTIWTVRLDRWHHGHRKRVYHIYFTAVTDPPILFIDYALLGNERNETL